ncbi:MAG TPA: hypothetical protein ENI29_08530 [bacterium]|nr:hypothetical protein [bacterium]
MIINKKMIMDIIEPVLFKEEELSELKNLINDVGANKIEPKQLRKAIIDNRVRIMGRLIDSFFFQIKREVAQQEINNFTGTNHQIQSEVEEKDRLLEQIAERLQTIYTKAMKN